MRQSFFIPGPLPGMNDFAGKKSRWTYAALKKETDYAIVVAIHARKLSPMSYATVLCRWFEPNTKRDPDNICAGLKFILDALVLKKILPGDGWQQILGITHEFLVNRNEPGVEVTLEQPCWPAPICSPR